MLKLMYGFTLPSLSFGARDVLTDLIATHQQVEIVAPIVIPWVDAEVRSCCRAASSWQLTTGTRPRLRVH